MEIVRKNVYMKNGWIKIHWVSKTIFKAQYAESELNKVEEIKPNTTTACNLIP